MKPVLLLIPGMLNTPAIWDWVVPLLKERADIRIADVLTQETIAGMADDAWAQLGDVPAETPVVVCGFSMGGYVALDMLAHVRRPLHAVGLLDTSGRPESAEGLVVREKTIAAMERNFAKVVDGLVPFGTHPDSHARAELMQALQAIELGTGAPTAIRQVRAIMGRGDHRAALARLSLPTLVMCGRGDRITPPELSEELAALIPGARLEWIEGAGHMGLAEQPDRVAALIATLL
ncbi:MAG: alpha/beta fold hydrolase [Polaromonas sp.]|uniref:alpha/beta fold hydrolase n=1 Tax=Polaromonas sp. TaxID=1869339 RepID=UPI0024881B2E|nr:alpha/beta fold hydrolase [Polaromonas sp.]MDI1239713.1 alpha/beta fold hydrolase [Polaromonas sp.]